MTEQMLTIEQEAAQVLERMARLVNESKEAVADLVPRLEAALANVKAVEALVAKTNAERDTELAELEERAKGLGLRAEQTVKTEHGAIKFRSGYLRVSYDARGLDAVAKVPEHNWIRQYRKESSVAPSVKVKVNEDAQG